MRGSHTGACRRRPALVFPRPIISSFIPSLPPSLSTSSLFFLTLLAGGPCNPSAISRACLVKVSASRTTNFGEEARVVQAATCLNINSSFPSINSTCAIAAMPCLRRCLAGRRSRIAVASTKSFVCRGQTLSAIARSHEIIEITSINVSGGIFSFPNGRLCCINAVYVETHHPIFLAESRGSRDTREHK